MMEDYYKGPICAQCVGIALKKHAKIIDDKILAARKREDEI